MTTKELIWKKIDALPKDLYQEFIDYLDFLLEKKAGKKNARKSPGIPAPQASPKKSLYGIWAAHGEEITSKDIDQARKEMWGNFPRDDF